MFTLKCPVYLLKLLYLLHLSSAICCICLVNHYFEDDTHKFCTSRQISYGGVIHTKTVHSATAKEDVLKKVISIAKKRFPQTIPVRQTDCEQDACESWPHSSLHFHKVVSLAFTSDDIRPLPAVFVYEDASHGEIVTFNGDLHYIKFSWKNFSLVHSMTVLETFTPPSLYIQQHTFYNESRTVDQRDVFEESCRHSEHSKPQANLRYSPSHSLKILTYNLWNTNNTPGNVDGYTDRLDQAAKLIRTSGADIIGLQEVRFEEKDRSWSASKYSPDQVSSLASRLPGFQYIYQPAQLFPQSIGGLWVEEGLAIFSKYPIRNHDYIIFTRDKNDLNERHQRICLRAEIDVPNVGLVNVFVTHLSLSHLGREAAVVEIWKYMERFQGPAVLLGDLNAESHSKECRFLRGATELQGLRTKGLKDLWLEKKGKDNPGHTFNTLDNQLSKRIDFIYARDSEMEVLDVMLVDDGARMKSVASDHIGVMGIFGGKPCK